MIVRLVISVLSAGLELGGLGLVIVGVRGDRRRAADLLAQLAPLEPKEWL